MKTSVRMYLQDIIKKTGLSDPVKHVLHIDSLLPIKLLYINIHLYMHIIIHHIQTHQTVSILIVKHTFLCPSDHYHFQ